jgi:WD40 repeat protein
MAVRGQLSPPAIVPRSGTLTPPGAETARLEGHTSGVNALCVLPDGRLASGSDDGTIRIWEFNTVNRPARLEGHTNSVRALCLLPDGRLASGSYDNAIRIWAPSTGAKTTRLDCNTNSNSALCLLPDGRLASGSGFHDSTIRLWDLNTGTETARLETDAPILCLAIMPSGHLVAGDRLGRLHWLEVVDRDPGDLPALPLVAPSAQPPPRRRRKATRRL